MASNAPEDRHVNDVLECVGVAFGAHLVRQLGFTWCVCTDEWGTDIAVRASPDRADVTIVPVDFVAKRWDRREAPFIVHAVKEIEATLARIAAEFPADS